MRSKIKDRFVLQFTELYSRTPTLVPCMSIVINYTSQKLKLRSHEMGFVFILTANSATRTLFFTIFQLLCISLRALKFILKQDNFDCGE